MKEEREKETCWNSVLAHSKVVRACTTQETESLHHDKSRAEGGWMACMQLGPARFGSAHYHLRDGSVRHKQGGFGKGQGSKRRKRMRKRRGRGEGEEDERLLP